MNSRLFLYIYLGGIIVRPLIRLPAFIKANRGAIKEDRADFRERFFMVLLLLGMLVFPLLALGPWLSELSYDEVSGSHEQNHNESILVASGCTLCGKVGHRTLRCKAPASCWTEQTLVTAGGER